MTDQNGAERSSATEVLRRMLDERGVEWWQKKRHTCWKVSKGQEVEMWRAWEAPDGSLTLKVDYIYGLTPEQAIAATLGTGTCHIKPWKMERDTGFYDCMECECGYVSDVSDWAKWHFCPNCGRRIVEPTTNGVDAEVGDD